MDDQLLAQLGDAEQGEPAPVPPPAAEAPAVPEEDPEGADGLSRKQKRQQKNDSYWDRANLKRKQKEEQRWERKKARNQARRDAAGEGAEPASAEAAPAFIHPPFTLALRGPQGGGDAPQQGPLRLAYRYTARQPEDASRRLHHGCFLKSCKWSPDGSALLTNGEDNVLRVHNLPEACRALGSDYDTPNSVVADYPEEIGSSGEGSPMPWEAALCMSEGESIYDYAWYPRMSDPQHCCFATTSREHPIHLWDAASGLLRATYRGYNEVGEPISPHSLCFSPEGEKILAGYKSELRVFDSERSGESTDIRPTRYKIAKRKSGLSGLISTTCFSPRHISLFAAGSFTSQFVVGDLRTQGRSVAFVKDVHKGGITHMMFSRCGQYIYTAARKDGAIKVWDIRLTGAGWDGKYRDAAELRSGEGGAGMSREVPTNQRVTFDLDISGRFLYSGCHSGYVKVFDVKKMELVTKIAVGRRGQEGGGGMGVVSGVACHPTLPIFAATTGERRFSIDPTACGTLRHFTAQPAKGGEDDDSSSDSESSSSSSSAGDAAPPVPEAPAPPTTAQPTGDAAEAVGAAPVEEGQADEGGDAVSVSPDSIFGEDDPASACNPADNVHSTLELWTGRLLAIPPEPVQQNEAPQAQVSPSATGVAPAVPGSPAAPPGAADQVMVDVSATHAVAEAPEQGSVSEPVPAEVPLSAAAPAPAAAEPQ